MILLPFPHNYYPFCVHCKALARVQSELDILSRERSSLMIEKQHFADEVGAQKALVSSALALKAQLKAQYEELICKEEEVQVRVYSFSSIIYCECGYL